MKGAHIYMYKPNRGQGSITGLLVLAVVSTSIAVLFFLWYTGRLTIPESVKLLRVIEIIGSLMLTALLIILYFSMFRVQGKQGDIQEQQADIMEQQEELMEAEIQPIIDINENNISASEGTLSIPISNYGNGIAKNLRLLILIEPDSSDVETFSTTISLERAFDYSDSMHPQPVNAIDSGEAAKIFNSVIEIFGSIGPGVGGIRMEFQDAMRATSYEEVERIGLHIFLLYDNIAGRTKEKAVLGRRGIKVKKDLTIEDALEQGHRVRPRKQEEMVLPSKSYLLKRGVERVRSALTSGRDFISNRLSR